MSTTTVFRQDLLTTFERLQKDFNQALADAKAQETAFNEACQIFQDNMAKHIQASREKVSDKNPMTKPLDTIKSVLEQTNQNWNNKIKNRDKGVRFRAGFNDSLLVFVYGKVKSGKSSLGNYMAWGNTDPTDDIKDKTPGHLHPVYFSGERTDVKSGDGHKEAESNKEFRVGATEATSTIQGFSLPGLTWVDSPGLHSFNAQNGELAKQYVEHSDLILYTMKSDSPGRGSDVQEIAELYRADKKIILLITGSDDTEEDEDENGQLMTKLIMKDKDRRQRQIEHVRQALESEPTLTGKTGNIEIVSFSARYAQLHSEEANEFDDSGMGQLFARLQQTAAQDGVKLKQQAPMRNFSQFMQSFAKDMAQYKDSIQEFQKPIARLEKEVPSEINQSTRNLQRQLGSWLDKEFEPLLSGDRIDANKVQEQLTQLGVRLGNYQSDLMINEQIRLLESILKELQDDLLVCMDENPMLAMPEFTIDTRKEQVEELVAGNKSKASAIGGAVGGGLGVFLGGVAGALIGSAIGSFVGRAFGDDDKVVYKDIAVKTSDNLNTIKAELQNRLNASTKERMDIFANSLIGAAINDIKALDVAINQEIIAFEQKIEQINQTITQTLNS